MLTEPTKMPEDLENLSIPELDALLFSDFVNTKDSPNTDLIIKVLEVIEKKEQESTRYEPINIDQAWSDFQEFYLENQLDSCRSTIHVGQVNKKDEGYGQIGYSYDDRKLCRLNDSTSIYCHGNNVPSCYHERFNL